MKAPHLQKQTIIVMAGWSLLICGIFSFEAYDHWQTFKTLALNEARISYDKDILYRRWAAMHGGVYAPVTEKTQPNPDLAHIPERDITTPSGKKLTLVNPAYMTRQIYELARQSEGVLGHITSLNPIRAENAPDPWETRALQAFQQGTIEVSSLGEIDGRQYMRFMRPMITEDACLKCHAGQGYRKGDIRGGISVAVPMDLYMPAFHREIASEILVYALTWLVVIGLIYGGSRKIRRQTKELLSSEERYRLLVELSPDMVAIHKNGVFDFINRGGVLLLGARDEGQIVGRPVLDFVHPDYHDIVNNRIDSIINKSGNAPIIEEKFVRIDGTTVDVDVAALPFEYQGEKAVFVLARDITQRKLAEHALQESEEKYRQLFNMESDAIFLIDNETGDILDVNDSALALYGHTRDALVLMKNVDLSAEPESTQEAMAKKALMIPLRWHRKKDGTIFPVEIAASHLIWKGRPVHIAAIRDITHHRRLEEQLMQSQKMEAIGILAGGVAHDFNNILSAIIGYASILQMKMKKDDPFLENVQEILSSSEKAAVLVQSLLAFSSKQIINPRPTNINEAIKKVEKLLLRVIGEDIEFRTRYADTDLIVLVDTGQFEQALMNLATNARDAMPKGGTLAIETSRISLDEAFIKGHGYGQKGEYALVTVSDTGAGMDEKTRERIFEPFFTTKEMGRGTGLGLSMVYGVVRQNKGFIDCSSEPGKGTSFMIYLPLTEVEVKEITKKEPATIARGTETILVAEDDESLRRLYQSVLQELGYTVIVVSDGEEAVARFRESRVHVDLLILDMVMPKKNGMEAYEAIQQVKPGIKALFVSGYTADILKVKGAVDEGIPLIMKPVSPIELAGRVRELLDKRKTT